MLFFIHALSFEDFLELGPISTPVSYGYIIEFHRSISIGTCTK
jgi:hypothetical protein